MSWYVRYRHGLTGGKSRLLCSTRHLSGRRISEGGRAGLRHRDLTPRPSTRQFDRAARPVVTGSHVLEVVQHMLGTIGRLDRQAVMIGVPESAAPAHGHKPRVPLLTENHFLHLPVLIA